MEALATIDYQELARQAHEIDYEELSRHIAARLDKDALLTVEDIGAILRYKPRYIRETLSVIPVSAICLQNPSSQALLYTLL